MKVVGAILAGGRAERMGGGDKGLQELAGRSLLEYALERLLPQVDVVVLSANGDPERFRPLSLPVVADGTEASAGPLAGILAALRWTRATAPAAGYVASVPCDAPFFPGDLVRRLGEADPAKGSVRLAASRGVVHPVFGLWPVGLADRLARWLESGMPRSVHAFAEAVGLTAVPFEDEAGSDPFFNINTPDALRVAQRLEADRRRRAAAPSGPGNAQ